MSDIKQPDPIIKRLSYSAIKTYRDSPQKFKHVYIDGNRKVSSDVMAFGSLVDAMLTEADTFDEKYAVRTVEAPTSAQQLAFANDIVDTAVGGITPNADEIWARHYSSKGKTPEAIIAASKVLFETLKPYMEYLIDVRLNDKKEVSQKDVDRATKIIEAIKNHKVANHWINVMPGEFQKELWWNSPVIDIPILGYLDKSIVDIDNQRALVVDLKISSAENEYKFRSMAKRFWYHGQTWMYTTGLEQKLFHETGKHFDVSHLYVVVNSEEPHQVMCVKFADTDLDRAAEEFYEAAEGIKSKLISEDWTHNPEITKLTLYPPKS